MKRTTFDLPLPVARGGEPLRTQVVRAMRGAIQSRRLEPGSVVPSSRTLAGDLGVSRGIVVAAYEQLLSEGYLVSQRGSATRVARMEAQPGARGAARTSGKADREVPPAVEALDARRWRYDFRPGIPDVAQFPARAWMKALRRAWASGSSVALDYPATEGVHETRAALASYLNRSRATVASADRIVMCTGFAQAARLVCEVLRARGVRRIAVEDPGPSEQCADLRASGIETVPVPVDDDGLRVDLLERRDVGAVLLSPAHQYPTGAVLSPERRAALLAWAARRAAFVIEDDYDAEYRYDGEPVGALQGLMPDRVIYIGTASKVLAPALRQGWIVVPGALARDVSAAKLSADRGSPALEQRALAAFIEAGDLDRHLRRSRALYRRRRDALVAAFAALAPGMRLRGSAAGLHVLLELPARADEAAIVEGARRHDIRLFGTRAYHLTDRSPAPGILLGYGAVPEEEILGGVRALLPLITGPGAARDARAAEPSGRIRRVPSARAR